MKRPKPAKVIKTCGDAGGRTAEGTPCERAANFGVKRHGDRDGRCKEHNAVGEAVLQGKKKAVLALFRTSLFSLQRAAKQAAKVDSSTVWRWRQRDPEFDAAYREAQEHVDGVRLSHVEDTLYQRIVKGDASAAEVIFWLKNRGKQRWRDKIIAEVTGADGQPLIPIEALRSLVLDDEPRPKRVA